MPQQVGQALNYQVTGPVPVLIIHLFKVIKIEHGNNRLMLCPTAAGMSSDFASECFSKPVRLSRDASLSSCRARSQRTRTALRRNASDTGLVRKSSPP